MSKYWVFNEAQLSAALASYARELESKPGAFDPAGVFDAHSNAVHAFLTSDSAKRCKLLQQTQEAGNAD